MRRVVLFLSSLTALCSFSLDDPIIMERIVHRVEWDELLTEYDPTVAPVRNMTVNVDASLVSFNFVNYPKREAHGIYEVVISWKDERLRIANGVRVAVPSHIKVWKPFIIVHNAIADQQSLTAMCYSGGKFKLHQRRILQLAIKRNDSEIEPVFRSFEDGSADDIQLITNIQGTIPLNSSTEGWELRDH